MHGRSGKVPYRMTSNGYLADVYASVADAFLRDWSRGGSKETPLILEVGGGNGLFAWLFLNRLMRHQASGEAVPGFDYLLTDAAASNVQAWRQIPRLRHLVDAGPLDMGVLKIGGEVSVETSSSESWTEQELTARPVVLIANYVWDSIPCEMIRIREGRVFQELVALERADGQDEDTDAFQGLTSRFRVTGASAALHGARGGERGSGRLPRTPRRSVCSRPPRDHRVSRDLSGVGLPIPHARRGHRPHDTRLRAREGLNNPHLGRNVIGCGSKIRFEGLSER